MWIAAVVALFVFTAVKIDRQITWYLAVDQYGYLNFAHDLLEGRVFHQWPPLDALAPRLPPHTDVLSQTYVYDQGRMHCRYAPGFALMLAAWLGLFGDDGAHYLNPTVFMALLGLVLAFQARLFRSRWYAVAGVAVLLLLPTSIHLWALTLVRDLATHLSALLGLFLLLPVRGRRLGPGRAAAAGVALGWAASIRPDAVLYLVPAGLLGAARWWRERPGVRSLLRTIGAGVLGLSIGLAPFLAYNWLVSGNPFRPTQGMEMRDFLPGVSSAAAPLDPTALQARLGFPSGAWRGGTVSNVQGGALSLRNLPTVLPANLRLIRAAYGDVLLGFVLWGALVALVRRRMLFLTAVPYSVLALLFFSCWSSPHARYLTGVFVFMPMLLVEGTLGTLHHACVLARVRGLDTARVFRRGVRVAAPVLAFVLVGLACVEAVQRETRARFQRPQMLRARATLARAVDPKAVIITTEDIGRPAENIDYYSGVAHAFYLTDLERWHLSVADAAALLARGGFTPHLLLRLGHPGREELVRELEKRFRVERVADIPPERAIDYFVAAAFHRGLRLHLYRLAPK